MSLLPSKEPIFYDVIYNIKKITPFGYPRLPEHSRVIRAPQCSRLVRWVARVSGLSQIEKYHSKDDIYWPKFVVLWRWKSSKSRELGSVNYIQLICVGEWKSPVAKDINCSALLLNVKCGSRHVLDKGQCGQETIVFMYCMNLWTPSNQFFLIVRDDSFGATDKLLMPSVAQCSRLVRWVGRVSGLSRM